MRTEDHMHDHEQLFDIMVQTYIIVLLTKLLHVKISLLHIPLWSINIIIYRNYV